MQNKQATILAVGAHHDDNEMVAGTLARHKAAGWRIVSVVMTDGRYIDGKAAEEHVAVRDAESRAAAELLGMETVFLRFREGNVECNTESVRAVVEVIRRYAPQVVITHPPKDYHLDHMKVSEVVYEAVFRCGSGAYDCEVARCARPNLYFADAWFVPFVPDEYVDITEFHDLKLDMLRCHKSQLTPPEGSPEDNMIDMERLRSRRRGIEAGVQYAEGFRLVSQLGRGRLAKLLR